MSRDPPPGMRHFVSERRVSNDSTEIIPSPRLETPSAASPDSRGPAQAAKLVADVGAER
jgi:hypothetical protein